MNLIEKKFLGAMVGMALGDAIGELAYRFPRRAHLYAQIADSDQLFYTGDTALGIALAESVLSTDEVDIEHVGKTIRHTVQTEQSRCFGPGLPRILKAVEEEGLRYSEAARQMYKGQGSLGNGAAVRVPAVGLLYYHSPDLYDQAVNSAKATHMHPLGTDGAAVTAKAIAQSILLKAHQLDTAIFCEQLAEFAKTPEMKGKMLRVGDLIADNEMPMKAAQQLGRSITVHESMPFAVFCFLRSHESFEDALVTAISNGGDCNTLGAMTGAMSGAYLGIDAISPMWRSKLENYEHIESLALALCAKAQQQIPVTTVI